MKPIIKNIYKYHPLQKAFVMGLSTAMICLICTSTYTSDIEIYKEARSGKVTLMFTLDISGSMADYIPAGNDPYDLPSGCNATTAVSDTFSDSALGVTYSRKYRTCAGNTKKYYRRLDRVRDAMYQLLYGTNAIADNRIIGLAVFPQDSNEDKAQSRAQILVPARALDETVNGIPQRKKIMQSIASITGAKNTPTANAYAEVASYLFGTKTYTSAETITLNNAIRYRSYQQQVNSTRYQQCNVFVENACTEWTASQNTKPTGWPTTSGNICSFNEGSNRTGSCWFYSGSFTNPMVIGDSGFFESATDTWNGDKTTYQKPSSLIQSDTQKQCSGQGIYLLTDGSPNNNLNASTLMKNALDTSRSSFSCTSSANGWSCMQAFVQNLLDSTKNPLGLKVKTAVVGFGNAFNSVPSYSKTLSEAENIAAINQSGASDDQKNAAKLGVVGQGGWYSGTSIEDVVNSVKDFVNNLSTEIPAVTTGTSTIPTDQLHPSALQNFAYYPQFQPTPDKNYRAWVGNLKKYKVAEDGTLRDKNNSIFVNNQGKILSNYDLWSANAVSGVNQDDENILGSDKNRLVGGVKSRLKLRALNGQDQRKILTDRAISPTGNIYTDQSTLNQLASSSLALSSDPARGYLLSLLGYRVNAAAPETITSQILNNAAELRQVGAIMHSSPLLLTNAGKVTFANNQLSSENREDYVLFGTTQGVLHVVNADSGEEKFAFVPNAMVENQKEAFMNFDSTIGPIDQLYYGVDGAWTAYTEYVNAANNLLTVGEGLNNQVGKQLVYGGLRMGGRNYYALDLHDMNNPKLQFAIKPSGTCSASNPLGCMGQSWSKPTLTWIKWKGAKKLVMLVGGGYDDQGLPASISSMPETTEAERIAKQAKIKYYAGYEYDDYQQTNKVGAGVYMFDALSGGLLWWASANANNQSTATYVPTTGPSSSYDANMKYSVVSQIRAIDRDGDGLSDHLYFGDLGGQVWRIDINNQNSKPELFAKTPTRILNLNHGVQSPRFYEMPSFSTYTNNGELFAVVAIGSGNRSQPLAEYSTTTGYSEDGVFSIYDKDVARNGLFETNQNQQYTMVGTALKTKDINLLSEGTSVGTVVINQLVDLNNTHRFSIASTRASYALTQGWYYLFKSNLVQSEKVFTTPLVINKDMFVTTFDSSKDGLSGDCGAGVKGESFMTLFCMPYGQCDGGSITTHKLSLGVGLVGGAVGAGDSKGMTRLIVANLNTSGISGNAILAKRYLTVNKLIPQRWYDRNY